MRMYCSHICISLSEIICNISVLLLQMLNASRLYMYRCSSLPKHTWLQHKHSITVHHFTWYFTQDVKTHRSNWLFLLTCYTFLLIFLCFVVTKRSVIAERMTDVTQTPVNTEQCFESKTVDIIFIILLTELARSIRANEKVSSSKMSALTVSPCYFLQ